MSMFLEISAESGFLHVKAMGEFSLVEAKRTFIEVTRGCLHEQGRKGTLRWPRTRGKS